MSDRLQTGLSVKQLQLRNFRIFEEVQIDFHPSMNVLIGINGAGKTSVLECLARMLRVYQYLLLDQNLTGIRWNDLFGPNDLRYEALQGFCFIEADLRFSGRNYKEHDEGDENPDFEDFYRVVNVHWQVALDAGRTGLSEEDKVNDLAALEELAFQIRRRFNDKKREKSGDVLTIPIVVFYPSNIELRTRADMEEKEIFQSLSPYDSLGNGLDNTSMNYEGFFRWFRWMHSKQRTAKEDHIFKQVNVAASGILNSSSGKIVYQNLHVDWDRSVVGELAIEKNGDKLRVSQLSEGEKRLLLMAVNLAYRLILANPDAGSPLQEGTGIVLIDEIDLHLHPQWEEQIVPNLQKLFPNIQFIITTHSPAVLQNVSREHIIVLEDGQVRDKELNPFTKGRQFDEVAQDAFGLPVYPEHTPELYLLQEKIRRCFDLIDQDKLDEAEVLYNELLDVRGPDDSDMQTIRNMLELARS